MIWGGYRVLTAFRRVGLESRFWHFVDVSSASHAEILGILCCLECKLNPIFFWEQFKVGWSIHCGLKVGSLNSLSECPTRYTLTLRHSRNKQTNKPQHHKTGQTSQIRASFLF